MLVFGSPERLRRFLRERYKLALEELNQANQNDPFIECMIGQT